MRNLKAKKKPNKQTPKQNTKQTIKKTKHQTKPTNKTEQTNKKNKTKQTKKATPQRERSRFYALCTNPHDIFSGRSGTCPTFSRDLLPIDLQMYSLPCHHLGWFATRLLMSQT